MRIRQSLREMITYLSPLDSELSSLSLALSSIISTASLSTLAPASCSLASFNRGRNALIRSNSATLCVTCSVRCDKSTSAAGRTNHSKVENTKFNHPLLALVLQWARAIEPSSAATTFLYPSLAFSLSRASNSLQIEVLPTRLTLSVSDNWGLFSDT